MKYYPLYDAREEHDACGVGFVAAVDGQARRDIVEKAIAALKAVWHRGAVGSDGKTGDGAGIHLAIPQAFFEEQIIRTGHKPLDGTLAVGMVFLPRTDLEAKEKSRSIIESEILRAGHYIYGWRHVPVDLSVVGDIAQRTRPEIEQILIADQKGLSAEDFERDLYLIRRRIEKSAANAQISGLYLCSFSSRSIIYKGLFLAESLSFFYPDLQDNRFESNFAIFHQRYSTNTFPQWWLAQPFRALAHNGEINTIRGNINWMKNHEIKMASRAFGDASNDIKPVIPHGASDSAALDAVFEVLVRAGRSAPMAKTMLLPETWSRLSSVPQTHQDMYAYINSVMEPWDGPAAIAATDGRYVLAGLDRSGLRPMRYLVTADQLVCAGSEAGMFKIPAADILCKGRVGPGQMIGVDLKKRRFLEDRTLKDHLSSKHPFAKWIKGFKQIQDFDWDERDSGTPITGDDLFLRQLAAGITSEILEHILHPQAESGSEAVSSMGDDTPPAVIAKTDRNLAHFFRQRFSQVTNPPLDSIRERRVMSLLTRIGNFADVLDQDNPLSDVLVMESPVLLTGDYHALRRHFGDKATVIDCTFPASDDPKTLTDAIERIKWEAEQAITEGRGQLFLTDEQITRERAAIPMILAAGGIHSHLLDKGLRTHASINVRAAECFDAHYLAVLVGVGATTVNPYLAQSSIRNRHKKGLFEKRTLDDCFNNFKRSLDGSLLKIMAKMGVSVLSSYRGAYNFEALGLSRALVNEFFPGLPSRISGIGMGWIKRSVLRRHKSAFKSSSKILPIGSFLRYRAKGETHGLNAHAIHALQMATASGSYDHYQRYLVTLKALPPVNLRDLLDFEPDRPPLSLDQVSPVTAIRKRFIAPAMSIGALSAEAHETLAIAMNRIGAKSSSGEGGENPARYQPYDNGDNANSAIKQVASGRFGVTADYLNHCREIEIKVAQGAKPGEGGQLPGFKVTEMIAKLRHSTPGVTLISPPPHHDIYSIEDLAQLIYDLKQINPGARICVKLVASVGIGTVAAGVAKAHADVISISGHSGGTGAAAVSSIKHAGIPWELGLAEANQVLVLNGLRDRVTLRVDGGIKTGRDVVIAALLGAEEFGIGTASLIAMGCLIVRQCHSNTCPVGICTQDERLREKFSGSPEKVVNLMSFIAEEVREILAELGAGSLQEIIGRCSLLKQVSRGDPHLDDLDLNAVIAEMDRNLIIPESRKRYNRVPWSLDERIITDAAPLFTRKEKMELSYDIANTDRSVGTRLSGELIRNGLKDLQDGHLTIRLKGSAGQSLGAFGLKGLQILVEGDANDYVGKGLSGAIIALRPPRGSRFAADENTIAGNTVLYGATSGKLFAAGQAGERFAVRNSGAIAVIEGCGANGCEYMTGGIALILGDIGDNFAAGMSGGTALVYDPDAILKERINADTVQVERGLSAEDADGVKALLENHITKTGSKKAAAILTDFAANASHFWHIIPKDLAAQHFEVEDGEKSIRRRRMPV